MPPKNMGIYEGSASKKSIFHPLKVEAYPPPTRAALTASSPYRHPHPMNRLIVARSRRVAAARLSSASFRGGATRGAASAVVDLASTEERTDNDDGRFSIKGTFREGRAVYLDASATTPLDPRVLDKMMPYMVRCLVGWRKIPKTIIWRHGIIY